MKESPPKGVINQIDLAEIPPIVIKYMEPEKNRIPQKKRILIYFLDLSEKPL